MTTDAALRKRCVPAHYATAVVNVRFGSPPEIATDNWYADVDDDRLPDLAVGRLPCDSSAELASMVRKILEYERSVDFGVRVFGINPAATLTDRIITISRQRAKSTLGDESRWEEALGAEKLPFGRIKTPEEVAALTVMCCAPQVEYLSGAMIDMDGGGQFRR